MAACNLTGPGRAPKTRDAKFCGPAFKAEAKLHCVTIVAAALACLTLVWLVFALRTSFETHGGAKGQVPILAHAFGVALATMITWLVVERAWQAVSLPVWAYATVFVLAALAVGGALYIAGRIGAEIQSRNGMGTRR